VPVIQPFPALYGLKCESVPFRIRGIARVHPPAAANSSVDVVTMLWVGCPINPGSISANRKRLFNSSKPSRPVLVPAHPSVEMMSVSLSTEVKRPEHEAGDSHDSI
jgi:hypothetical protein